jgi:hypothetical protein
MRQMLVGAAVMVALAALAPSAGAAKAYRFKVDISVNQATGWSAHFREDAWCGADYHREWTGGGSGLLKGALRGGRITFRSRGGLLSSSSFNIPGSRSAHNDWTVQWVGTPDGTCRPDLPAPEKPDTSDCGKRKGKLASQLFVQRERLALLTAFERAGNPSTPLCPDPTAVSVSGSKPTPARRHVDDLIRNKRVRSIELSASVADVAIPGKKLNLPTGGTDLLSGSGNYDARWKVKLTRIPG